MKGVGDIERLPPQNIEAEQSVLGAVLLDNKVLEVAKELVEIDDFYRDSHRKIFSAMLELFQEGKQIDLITLAEKLRNKDSLDLVGGSSYLASLADFTPTAANVNHHAKIVREKAILRGVLNNVTETARAIYDGEEDVPLIIFESQKRLRELAERANGQGIDLLQMSEEDLMDHMSFFRETPLNKINDLIEGLQAKSLTIIGGRAGMGKTALELTFLKKWCVDEGLPCAYFGSSNHTREAIFLKLLSAMCNLDYGKLKRVNIPKEMRDEVRKAHKQIEQAKLFVQFESSMNVLSLASRVRAARNKVGQLGLIVVENIQDLVWPQPAKTKKERMDRILEVLRECENTVKTPMLVSSQINRESEDGADSRPHMSDLKDSGNIEDLADIVLLLHRNDYHRKTATDGLPSDGEIIIAKGGPAAIVNAKFYGHICCWKDE